MFSSLGVVNEKRRFGMTVLTQPALVTTVIPFTVSFRLLTTRLFVFAPSSQCYILVPHVRLYPKKMTNMNLKLGGTQRDSWQNLLATIVRNNKQYLSTPSWFACTVSHDQSPSRHAIGWTLRHCQMFYQH